MKQRREEWKLFFSKPPLDIDLEADAGESQRTVNLNAGLSYNTHKEVYMRTNIVLDDKLIKDAMNATGAKTKREVVDLALRQLVRGKARKDVRDLIGENLIDPDYDIRKLRMESGRGTRR